MTWVEQPPDGGSAVWGCHSCDDGGWCMNRTEALTEARRHAHSHGEKTIDILNAVPVRRGPKPDWDRDRRIAQLKAEHVTVRQIAVIVGLSASGVNKALRRIRGTA